jgi:hypothetical protein
MCFSHGSYVLFLGSSWSSVWSWVDDLVSEEGKGEIQLTSEDYLQGVIGMVNELVRWLPIPHHLQWSDLTFRFGGSSIFSVGRRLMYSLDYRSTQWLPKISSFQLQSLLSSTTFSPPTPWYVTLHITHLLCRFVLWCEGDRTEDWPTVEPTKWRTATEIRFTQIWLEEMRGCSLWSHFEGVSQDPRISAPYRKVKEG